MRALQGVLLLLYAGESVMGSGIGVHGTLKGCGDVSDEPEGKSSMRALERGG